MTFPWPEGIYPKSQRFYLRHRTTRFLSSFTAQDGALERDGARWVAEFTFELEDERSRIMDAFIAALRGRAGEVLVPDFRRIKPEPVASSMDAYALEIGPTFFDDRYDFDDQSGEDGFLATEQSPPLGMEDEALFGGAFDAALVFPGWLLVLCENGDMLLADNVGISFVTDKGFVLSIEHGDALEIAAEQGYELQSQIGEDLSVQVGGGFFEGDGQPTLLSGSDRQLLIGGLAPWTSVIKGGESIMPLVGHAHLILEDVITDINGFAAIAVAPRLRCDVAEQPLVLGGVRVLMRLAGDEAGNNLARPPCLSSYTLTFEQILT